MPSSRARTRAPRPPVRAVLGLATAVVLAAGSGVAFASTASTASTAPPPRPPRRPRPLPPRRARRFGPPGSRTASAGDGS